MQKSRIVFELGELRYEYVPDWLQVPHQLSPVTQVAAVACTSDGCVWAATRDHLHPIMGFDPDGRYMGSIGAELGFGSEHGLYATAEDHLLVCDSGRHVVYELDREGHVLLELGEKDHPCDNGFDPQVPYPYCLFTIEKAGAPFNKPTGAVKASDGSIWCCDGYGNASIHHFTADGQLLGTYGGPGREPGRFVNPHSIWVDKNGLVWVCDRDNHRVQVFDKDGSLVKCQEPFWPIDSPYGPSTLWSDGRYMFFSCDTRGMGVYDVDTLALYGILEAPRNSPMLGHSMCGNAQGDLFFGHLDPKPMITKLKKL